MEELENIKKQFNELMGEAEKLVEKMKEEKTEDKPWRARVGEVYFEAANNICDRYGVMRADRQLEQNANYDIKNYEGGNYFKNEWEAEKVAQHFNDYLVLLRDTKGFEPDWNNEDEIKYQVGCDATTGELEIGSQWGFSWTDIYFRTRADVKASIEKHGDIWKRYLGMDEESKNEQ